MLKGMRVRLVIILVGGHHIGNNGVGMYTAKLRLQQVRQRSTAASALAVNNKTRNNLGKRRDEKNGQKSDSSAVLLRSAPEFCSVTFANEENSKNDTRMNPVLLMEYDPSKVKYEQFPVNFKALCSKSLADEKNMVYARISLGESEYIANRGTYKISDIEDVNEGNVILIEGGKCQSFDIIPMLSTQRPDNGYRSAAPAETFPDPGSPEEGDCARASVIPFSDPLTKSNS